MLGMRINLEKMRKRIKGMTLEKMGEMLGVDYSTVHRWEKGKSGVPLDRMEDVAAAYQCRISEIYTDDDEQPSASFAEPRHIAAPQPPLPSEAALAVLLDVILSGTAGLAIPVGAARPAASALRLCLQLLQENPASAANDDVIRMAALAATARLPEPTPEA